MAMDEDEREGEAPLDAVAGNAVNIMTVHAAKGLEFPIVFVPDMGTGFREKFPPIMIGDNPLMVGVKVPNPSSDYEMTGSAVLLALREQQRQKERAEKKRLLYVALTRARDHLFMIGTMPEESGLSLELGRSRIEWVFTALGITGDAIAAGGAALPGGLRLAIVSDPLLIPAETGRVEPSLIVVPDECAGKAGTWAAPEYSVGPKRVKVKSVSELEKQTEKEPVLAPAREKVESKYLSGVKGETKGTIIHEVLRGRDASTVLKEYGEFSEERVRQCEEIRAAFLSSDLMKRVKRSYCEVPFVVTVDGRPVKGKIDRLCEMEDGSWVVIDYKSEPFILDEYASVAKEFGVSMGVYVKAAEQFLGGKPVFGLLYFTETAVFIGMNL
jgi:ATP-dependent helicase/nuclease subunit A